MQAGAVVGVHLIVQLLVLAGETKDADGLARQLEDLLGHYGFAFYRLVLRPRVLHAEKEVVLASAQRPYRLRQGIFALRNDPHRTRMQRMMQDAARTGMTDGYVVPVHGRIGLIGSLLVSSRSVDLSPSELALFDAAARRTLWRHLEFRGWQRNWRKSAQPRYA
ncbi:LuxR family transcriptional regulator [Pseudorhizobium tarimense]|uniref:LuxR family transcriptional regulator n=1 Tax=Pseudorhizobium tarimense TaxID=1079109 RepID=A0ABV2H833_9HYPH|nr:autoinducer binding domain-containing protein [Pseudorhizobium tarimense]